MGATSTLNWKHDPTKLGLDTMSITRDIGEYSTYNLTPCGGTVKLEYSHSTWNEERIANNWENEELRDGCFSGVIEAYTLIYSETSPLDFSDQVQLCFHNNLLVAAISHNTCLWRLKGWSRKKLIQQFDEVPKRLHLPSGRRLAKYNPEDGESIFTSKATYTPKAYIAGEIDISSPRGHDDCYMTFTERLSTEATEAMEQWVKCFRGLMK